MSKNNLKKEYRKIRWPDRRTALRETLAVILACAGLGVYIAAADSIGKWLIYLF